jgi:CRP/FNR family cyclic AMP-dependent transcriptional regulator
MKDNTVKGHLNTLRSEMIFSFIQDDDADKIIPFFDIVDYSVGSVVFKEGDSGDFIGFVVSGKLEVKKQTEFKGNQLIIALLSSGASVGELSIFDQHQRSATVEAIEDTTMLILRNTSLDALLQQHPYTGTKLLKGLIRILALRLRKATERLTTIF